MLKPNDTIKRSRSSTLTDKCFSDSLYEFHSTIQ